MSKTPSPVIPPVNTRVADGLIRAGLLSFWGPIKQDRLPQYLGDVYSIQLRMRPFVK